MSATAESVKQPAVSPAGRALVLYDGHCALCQKSVGLLKGLDWFGAFGFVDVRDGRQLQSVRLPVPPERLLEEMHLLTPGGRSFYHGFEAFRWMAWRLPAVWFLIPLLYVPGMATFGQRAYLWVARHRFRLVPCHGGVCRIGAGNRE
jgi:predicted DCC family thiol-disulfide oxidoreductase YuxK